MIENLKDEIRKAITGLNEDDAMLMKWKLIRGFIDAHKMEKKNAKTVREAAQFLDKYEKLPNGSLNVEFGDPYCKKYQEKSCKGCPISEYDGHSCQEPTRLTKKAVVIGPLEPVIESGGTEYPAFLNPYGNLQAQLDCYLAYDNENDFLKDHEKYRSWKEGLLNVVDEITLFLNNAIEHKHVMKSST